MLQRVLYDFLLCVVATSLVFAGVVVGPKAKAPKPVRGDEVLLGVQDGAKAPVTPRVATSGPATVTPRERQAIRHQLILDDFQERLHGTSICKPVKNF